MLILLLGSQAFSCRFLHGMGHVWAYSGFRRLAALFFQPESPENRTHCV